MKRLLTKESKRSVKQAYKGNAVFRAIDASYKEIETRMETLRFSTEEIFVNCMGTLDQLLRNRQEMDELTGRMWHDTYCELRDDAQEAGRDFLKEELETVTSCITYALIACLMASEEWDLIRHTEGLMMQIAAHSGLDDVVLPLDSHLDDGFILYIKQYIAAGKYLSDSIDTPQRYVEPVKPLTTPRDRQKAKEGIRERLIFMKGVLTDGETLIMTAADFNRMMEAAEYLVENNVVKKQDEKIRTRLSVAYLRYTFYLVYKNEGRCIPRDLWLEFLGETFQQMQHNQASLAKHFADPAPGYDNLLKPKKKRNGMG